MCALDGAVELHEAAAGGGVGQDGGSCRGAGRRGRGLWSLCSAEGVREVRGANLTTPIRPHLPLNDTPRSLLALQSDSDVLDLGRALPR